MIGHPLAGTPYGTGLELCVALAVTSWVLSLLMREYSWADRLWSVLPLVMCLIVAADLRFEWARVKLMTVLVVLWSIRLTANLALKGGYRKGGQDHRWSYLKDQYGPAKFQLLNLVGACFGQVAIVYGSSPRRFISVVACRAAAAVAGLRLRQCCSWASS